MLGNNRRSRITQQLQLGFIAEHRLAPLKIKPRGFRRHQCLNLTERIVKRRHDGQQALLDFLRARLVLGGLRRCRRRGGRGWASSSLAGPRAPRRFHRLEIDLDRASAEILSGRFHDT